MAQLRITIPNELTITFTCANYARVRARAMLFVTEPGRLQSGCRTETPGCSLEFCLDEDAPSPVWSTLAWGEDFDAFFFDNTVYNHYHPIDMVNHSPCRVRE